MKTISPRLLHTMSLNTTNSVRSVTYLALDKSAGKGGSLALTFSFYLFLRTQAISSFKKGPSAPKGGPVRWAA